MERLQHSTGMLDLDPTPSQEALRLIVEVFQSGYEAAADLRRTAYGLTPGELQSELQAIEQTMLTQISRICDNYEIQELSATRH